jgi:hypothetical protein
MSLPNDLYFDGVKYSKYTAPPADQPIQYYQLIVGQDYTAPCPAIVLLKTDQHAIFTEQWQYFVRAINYSMSIQHVSQLYEKGRAFFNGTGFPGKRNYLTGEGVGKDDPNADKVRSCLDNVVTGVETGTYLRVKCFDSRQNPPLKPGRSYPTTISEINIDDYLITPESNIEMFVVANIINTANELNPFPNGAVYPWTGSIRPFSFYPVINNYGYGDVLYPMSKVKKLPLGSKPPIPYTQP